MSNVKDWLIGAAIKLLSAFVLPINPARPVLQRIPVRMNHLSIPRRWR
jgi:hypothetical protein